MARWGRGAGLPLRTALFAASALVAVAAMAPMVAEAGPINSNPASGSTLNFGNVLVGSTSGGQSVTVTQTGQLTTRVVSSTLGGTNASQFGQNAATRTLPGTSPSTGTFTYTFAPTTTGTKTGSASLTSPQIGQGQQGNGAFSSTINLTGTGVAPAATLSTAAGVNHVRIGTTGTGTVQVGNTGNGNLSGLGAVSNLNMTGLTSSNTALGVNGAAASLADGASISRDVSFTPTDRALQSTTIRADFSNGLGNTNSSGFLTTSYSAQGVGPEFSSNFGSTQGAAGNTVLDFGVLAAGDPAASLDLVIGNITTDADLGILTALSIISVEITGLDAAWFDVADIAGTVLAPGQSVPLTVTFGGPLAPPGSYSGLLTIVTDQGTAFGGEGLSFSFNLNGVVLPAMEAAAVPEPMTLALFGAGLLGLAAARRTRRRRG